MAHSKYNHNPKLDLVIERIIDVPRELVWKAWTTPEHLMKWFTPAPWMTVACEIDLRPGGLFYTVMRSPEGTDHPNTGCYLEVVENEKLVWTDALEGGYRPSEKPSDCLVNFYFTAKIMFEPHKDGTKYTVIALHGNEEGRKKHEEMGFHEGWGTTLDQLVTYVKTL